MITLVIGGSCSGKSAFAEGLVADSNMENRFYIATMEATDEESIRRIARHRESRAHLGFTTLEYARDVDRAVTDIGTSSSSVALLECVSNLVAGEMFSDRAQYYLYGGAVSGNRSEYSGQISDKICEDISKLSGAVDKLIIVTNSIFADGNHYDEDTSLYIDILGRVNIGLNEMADESFEVVAGIPLRIK